MRILKLDGFSASISGTHQPVGLALKIKLLVQMQRKTKPHWNVGKFFRSKLYKCIRMEKAGLDIFYTYIVFSTTNWRYGFSNVCLLAPRMIQSSLWLVLTVILLPNVLMIWASNTGARVIEARRISSKTWSKGSQPTSHHPVKFAISLAGDKKEELDAKMYSIAMNRSSWLSIEELKYYVAPSENATSQIEAFLHSHGVTKDEYEYNQLGNILHVVTVASKVSKVSRKTNRC